MSLLVNPLDSPRASPAVNLPESRLDGRPVSHRGSLPLYPLDSHLVNRQDNRLVSHQDSLVDNLVDNLQVNQLRSLQATHLLSQQESRRRNPLGNLLGSQLLNHLVNQLVNLPANPLHNLPVSPRPTLRVNRQLIPQGSLHLIQLLFIHNLSHSLEAEMSRLQLCGLLIVWSQYTFVLKCGSISH